MKSMLHNKPKEHLPHCCLLDHFSIKMLTLIIMLTIFSATIPVITCKQIEVPKITLQTPLDIKLGRLEQVRRPDYDFTRVESRTVTKSDNVSSPF